MDFCQAKRAGSGGQPQALKTCFWSLFLFLLFLGTGFAWDPSRVPQSREEFQQVLEESSHLSPKESDLFFRRFLRTLHEAEKNEWIRMCLSVLHQRYPASSRIVLLGRQMVEEDRFSPQVHLPWMALFAILAGMGVVVCLFWQMPVMGALAALLAWVLGAWVLWATQIQTTLLESVELRSQAGLQAASLGLVSAGENLEPLAAPGQGWIRIRLEDGREGFVPDHLMVTGL